MNKEMCFFKKHIFLIFLERVNSGLQKTEKTCIFHVFLPFLFMQALLTEGFWILLKKRKHDFRSVRCAQKWKIPTFSFLNFHQNRSLLVHFVVWLKCLIASWSYILGDFEDPWTGRSQSGKSLFVCIIWGGARTLPHVETCAFLPRYAACTDTPW